MNRESSQDISSPNGGSIKSPNGRYRTNGSSTLMNADGHIMYRRSPSLHQPSLTQQQQQLNSYETVGTSPSAATSFNSDGANDNIISLEDDSNISELSQKFELLRRQVDVLTENQSDQDERYRRSRQENDILLNKIHNLEDQLRDLELSSETRAKEDEKRFREAMAKQTNTQQECEQHMQNVIQLQQDICKLQSDLLKSELSVKSLKGDIDKLENELQKKNSELVDQDNEIHKYKLLIANLKEEEARKDNIISILNEEIEEISNDRSRYKENNIHRTDELYSSTNDQSPPDTSKNRRFCSSRRTSVTSGFEDEFYASVNSRALKDIDGLEMSLTKLREENNHLKSTNEELQAQLLNAQLEEGRFLVQEGNKSYSLADEMGDIDVQKLMKALKEQQEVNARLRKYMDEILLKIVEKNPEILDKTVTHQTDRSKNSNIPTKQRRNLTENLTSQTNQDSQL